MVASDGKVGIGTNNPKATLDLHSGDDGVSARIVARRGSRNSYIALEGPIGSPYHSSIDVGQFTTGTNRKAIYISNEDNSSFGYVGIGRRAQTYRLEVNGNASKNAAGDWFANSDARLKTNIQQLNAEQTLQQLLTLKGVTYEWEDNKTGTDRPEGIQYGFTAQNIQEVFPTLVEEDAQGYLQTAYGTYDAMYVEALRTLQQQIDDQQRQIDALQTENQQLQQ
ncbi:MAG: tail fiber domain-containing protein, partial [Bacteroidota bacterium]